MASANIFAQYLQPPKSISEYQNDYARQDLQRLQLEGQQRQNALAGLVYGQQVQEAQQKNEGLAAYRALVGQHGDDENALIRAMRSSGNPYLVDQAATREGALLKRRDTESQIAERGAKTKAEQFKLSRDTQHAAVQDVLSMGGPQDALSGIDAAVQRGEMPPHVGEAMKRTLPQDAAGFGQWKLQMLTGIMSPEKMAEFLKPVLGSTDTGGAVQYTTRDPITGKVAVTGTTAKTVTPDAVLSANTSRANNADTIAAADRREAATRGKPQWDSERGVWVYPDGKSTAAIGADGKPLGPKDKAPPGYRTTPDGRLEAIPGGPADKLPDSQQKQVVGVQNLSSAIQEYRNELANWSKTGAVNPRARAAMGTKYNNMMLQAKEAYNLGVLNGGDYKILTDIVTDPASLKGTITPTSALDAQASELDRIMKGVAATSSQRRPQDAAPPPAGGGVPADIAALLKKHGGK